MIFLDRFKFTQSGVFGMFIAEDGEQLCFTIERPHTGDHPCIPCGVYDVIPHDSLLHPNTWEVSHVPCRTAILIHPANLASELLGCIGVGSAMGEINGVPAVLHSQDTFKMLKSKLPSNFTLTISEGINHEYVH